jgi:hypothetical protein
VAEEDEAWRGLWELIGYVLHLGVDFAILGPDLLGFCVDYICTLVRKYLCGAYRR